MQMAVRSQNNTASSKDVLFSGCLVGDHRSRTGPATAGPHLATPMLCYAFLYTRQRIALPSCRLSFTYRIRYHWSKRTHRAPQMTSFLVSAARSPPNGGLLRPQGLCVKISKVRYDDTHSILKDVSFCVHNNEAGALIRANEASIAGVVSLVARTDWDQSPALVLTFHGE